MFFFVLENSSFPFSKNGFFFRSNKLESVSNSFQQWLETFLNAFYVSKAHFFHCISRRFSTKFPSNYIIEFTIVFEDRQVFLSNFFFLIHKILFKRKGSAVPLSSRKPPQHHKYHKQWYFINKKNLLFDDFCLFFDSQVCSEDQHNPDTINDPTFFLKHLLDNWQTHVESPNGYAVFCAIQMVTVVVEEPMLLWKLLRIN